MSGTPRRREAVRGLRGPTVALADRTRANVFVSAMGASHYTNAAALLAPIAYSERFGYFESRVFPSLRFQATEGLHDVPHHLL